MNLQLGPIAAHVSHRLAWLRFGDGGPGFQVKDTRLHPLLFSQRGRGVQIGWLWLRVLPRT
jgi:hypothetical protein